MRQSELARFSRQHFGCRKTIFDATKVTYNVYSCAISDMSIEMMKVDDRDSVEYQNWEKKDINVIFELFKLEKDKTQIVFVSFLQKKSKT